MSALIDLFKDLDRLGPGNAESLRWVLDQAQTPADARVLDAGCGTGADLGVLLSRVPDGQVTALDSAAPFIDRVRRRFPRGCWHCAQAWRAPQRGRAQATRCRSCGG